jgi:hypothetical protein
MGDVAKPENRLLVPISIEALVVEANGGRWSDLSVDFSRLYEGDILGSELAPALFDARDRIQEPGVHLHWALPSALKRGSNTLARARRMAKAHGALADRLAATADEAERARLAKRLTDLWARLADLVHGDQLAGEQADPVAQLARGPDEAERARVAKRLTELGMQLAELAERDPPDDPQFPVIPNRWMVQRICRKPGTREISVRAWVVESDYRYAYDPDDPKKPKPTNAITVPIFDTLPLFDYVGRSFDYPDWAEAKHRTARVELTALGYGDPAFAAYYPACRSVLGFHDPLSDVQPDTRLAYLVVGWYSDPAKDILRSFDLEELNWTCPPPDAESYPSQILCHGSIYDIQWKGQKTYPPKVPFLDEKCQVAIGNTSAEAMAALLGKSLKKPGLETLLAAFQDDLLSKDVAPLELDARLHQSRFGSSEGGSELFIQRKEVGEDQPLTATDATLPESLERSLAELDGLQRKCDRQKRELDADRLELYATWYKWAREYLGDRREPAEITQKLDEGKRKIQERERQLGTDQGDLETRRKAITEMVQKQFSDLRFVASLAPPFWHANDPVVLISAPGLLPSRAHGRVGRDPGKDGLACRVTGGEITALVADIPNGQSGIRVSAGQAFQIRDAAAKDVPGVPRGIANLLREALLLDPGNADAIAEQAYRNAALATRPHLEELVQQIKTLQRRSPASSGAPESASSSHVDGVFPSLIALCNWDGNPWLPLFLEWRVSWRSSYSSPQDPLEHWELAEGEGEFRWNESPPGRSESIYEGYSIVSPHAVWNLKERLEKHREATQAKGLDQVITLLGEMNVLTQAFGGLHDAFIMRDQVLQVPPINPRIFSGHPAESPRDPIGDLLKGTRNLVSPDPRKPFYPVRAGHMRVLQLWVVDAFGQTVEVPEGAQLIRASRLATKAPDADQFLQFPPRFAQPLRLLFDWVPAENPPGTFPVSSPVCGWVIPNHLDQNLIFYDGSGAPLGALQKTLRVTAAGGTGGIPDRDERAFFWLPMPGTSQQPEGIHNPHLRRFVQFLEGMGADTGDRFWDLLDDALARTDPGEPEHDPILSVLLGRPLALVQASLRLELEGLPATDQSMAKIGKADTGGFTKVKFPLRLGEASDDRDGLVGFFKDDSNAGPFYAAAGAKGTASNGVIEYEDVHHLLDCETPVRLTLLMDPRTMVHVTTGILPKRSVELPGRVSAAAKSAKEAFFQVAPLISPGGDIRMPRPSDDFGKWSWAHRPQVTLWKESDTIAAVSDRAGFPPRPQQISEGWLKLKMNPVAILSFWLREGMLEVPMNTNVTLAWILQGGDRLRLLANEDEGEPLKAWATPPLPEQYKLQVKATTTFTLILEDKDGNRSEKRLTVRLEEGKDHGRSGPSPEVRDH